MGDLKSRLVNSTQHSKRLYTIKEAGIYLGRSVYSVRELIWDGKLPCVRVGRRIQLDIRDLDEFIKKHKVRNEY